MLLMLPSWIYYDTSKSQPPDVAGRLRDHRGKYFSEHLLVDTLYSTSFSGSVISSFSLGEMHHQGADSGQNMSLPAAINPLTHTLTHLSIE